MKLLYTNFHDDDGGGHTTYVLTLARHLGARHEVHIAAPGHSRLCQEAARIPGVHAVAQAFPSKLGARIQARRKLAKLLRTHDFDLVHVNGSADHRLVLSALHGLSRRPRIVWTKHNSKPMRGIGSWWRARTGTDQVIAVCDYTLRQLQQSPYRHCRLATVHNGIDLAYFSPWNANAAKTARQRLIGCQDQALVLGSNAGTADYKGWMDLIEALALLAPEEREQLQVVLAGKPPDETKLARISTLGLQKRVHFTGPLSDPRPLIAAIDLGFVLSYDVETLSFACREMMAMGKPVLLTNYAGLPENIAAGREGWLLPVRDPAAIAQALRRLLKQRIQLPEMGLAARQRAEAEFGLERFMERTDAVYRDLLESCHR